MNGWINTEREVVNLTQVCRIEFEYSDDSDLVRAMHLHCADGHSVRLFCDDPGWDEVVAMLAEQGIEVASANERP